MEDIFTKEQKIKVFEPMFEYFETEYVLNYFKDVITRIPDAIFYKPASSSGKYHNSQQIGKYGQLIHIYMFFDILNMFLGLEYNQNKFNNPIERDLMRCTPVLHDMCKYGLLGTMEHTTSEHPKLAEYRLNELNKQKNMKYPLKEEHLKILTDMCARHSGEWNKYKTLGYNGESIIGEMDKPENDREMLIHECDMLASRKFLTYEIPENLLEIFNENIKID